MTWIKSAWKDFYFIFFLTWTEEHLIWKKKNRFASSDDQTRIHLLQFHITASSALSLFFLICSPIWSPASSLPPASFPLSFDSYQPGRVNAKTRFLRDTRSQPDTYFQTAPPAAPQGSVTAGTYYLPSSTYTTAHRYLWLVKVVVIDREESTQ